MVQVEPTVQPLNLDPHISGYLSGSVFKTMGFTTSTASYSLKFREEIDVAGFLCFMIKLT